MVGVCVMCMVITYMKNPWQPPKKHHRNLFIIIIIIIIIINLTTIWECFE